MPLLSVEADQLTRIEFGDCAAAVTSVGTVGAVVSAGGGGGAGGVGLSPPPPPPQAERARTSDATAADSSVRFIGYPGCRWAEGGVNLTFATNARRQRSRARECRRMETRCRRKRRL